MCFFVFFLGDFPSFVFFLRANPRDVCACVCVCFERFVFGWGFQRETKGGRLDFLFGRCSPRDHPLGCLLPS